MKVIRQFKSTLEIIVKREKVTHGLVRFRGHYFIIRCFICFQACDGARMHRLSERGANVMKQVLCAQARTVTLCARARTVILRTRCA